MVTSSPEKTRTFLSTPAPISRTGMGLAIAVAATATAYGLGRFIYGRSAAYRSFKKEFDDWLAAGLNSLGESLGLGTETMDRLSKEVLSAAHACLSMSLKLQKVNPLKMDLLEIAIERRLTKMKLKVHKILELSEASQVELLHRFYAELRHRLLPESIKFELENSAPSASEN